MQTIKHVLIRTYLHILLILFFFTGGLVMFPLAPLFKRAFAPAAAYKDLRIFAIWAHVYRVIWRSLTDKSYRDMFASKYTDPPIWGNNARHVRIKESWRGSAENCDACELSCCAQIKCPMLDARGRCLSYGSIFFGYMYCGRHPENQLQMDRYNCPKWEVGNASEEVAP